MADGTKMGQENGRATSRSQYFEKVTGLKHPKAQTHLLYQIIAAKRLDGRGEDSTTDDEVEAALGLLGQIAPRDATESLLAGQMIGAHEAAMECLRRAMLEGQTFEGRDMALKHAARLMGLYARQLAALDKHRGRGQQKVTVEHVNVNAGGQAIVGSVESSHSAAQAPGTAAALESRREAGLATEGFGTGERVPARTVTRRGHSGGKCGQGWS